MKDLGIGVLLLLIGIFAGLLGDFLRKQTVGKSKRQITYSTTYYPIVAISGDLPQEVAARLPNLATADNLVRFTVTSENLGTLQIKDANLIIRVDAGAMLLEDSTTVVTIPDPGVPHGKSRIVESALIVPDVTLEPGEKITVVGYLRQRDQVPRVKAGWEGGGGELLKVEASSAASPTFDRHVTAIVFNLILAFIGTDLVGILVYGSGVTVEGQTVAGIYITEGIRTRVTAGLALLGLLWRLYFLLRTIPHIRSLVTLLRAPANRSNLATDVFPLEPTAVSIADRSHSKSKSA